MGAAWVKKIKDKYLKRAAALEILDFNDEDEGTSEVAACPVCSEGGHHPFTPGQQ